jgi:hypothetical protein
VDPSAIAGPLDILSGDVCSHDTEFGRGIAHACSFRSLPL